MTRRYNRKRRNSRLPCRNIKNDAYSVSASTGSFVAATQLIKTESQNYIAAPYAVTVGNFVINMTLDAIDNPGLQGLDNITAFIFFVPEGISIDSNIVTRHPEWILAYKYLGSPTGMVGSGGQAFQPFRISSKRRRRLQTGDGIYLIFTGVNNASSNQNMKVNTLLTWSSRTN